MRVAIPSQLKYHLRGYILMKARRECWRSRLYQIWSRWRLLDPDPAATMFPGQQSMLDRMDSGTTPKKQ